MMGALMALLRTGALRLLIISLSSTKNPSALTATKTQVTEEEGAGGGMASAFSLGLWD